MTQLILVAAFLVVVGFIYSLRKGLRTNKTKKAVEENIINSQTNKKYLDSNELEDELLLEKQDIIEVQTINKVSAQ